MSIDGYAIQTADDEIQPEHWCIYITEVDKYGKQLQERVVDEQLDTTARGRWETNEYLFGKEYLVSKVTLKIYASTKNFAEC